MTSRALLAALAVLLLGAPARASSETYAIDAQYRGGISVDFPRIGGTSLSFLERTDGAVHTTGRAHARHPRDRDKVYDITLDVLFRLDGNRVTVLKSSSTSNATGDALRQRIEKILPFLHLATKLPEGARIGPRWYFTPHGAFEVSAESVGATREVIVLQGPREIGKFFLNGTRLAKFRIPTKDNIVLNFVATPALASVEL